MLEYEDYSGVHNLRGRGKAGYAQYVWLKSWFFFCMQVQATVQTAVEHGNIYVEELNIKKCGYELAKYQQLSLLMSISSSSRVILSSSQSIQYVCLSSQKYLRILGSCSLCGIFGMGGDYVERLY